MSSLLAPSERKDVFQLGSVVASPVATFTTTGNKAHDGTAVKMAGTVPMPNQMTRIGTTAIFGTL